MASMSSNAFFVSQAINRHGLSIGPAASKSVAHHGLLLQAAVKRRAAEPRTAARPAESPQGPRLVTGDYNRSIYLRHGAFSAEVGTNKPQGRRLEFGFTDTDSLGRSFDQQPYPHFGPAVDEISPLFLASLAKVAAAGWGKG